GSFLGIYNSGTLTVSGGTVKSTGTDGNNYGIYNYYHGAGSLELSGAPTITGATAGVYLDGGIITLGGELSYTQGNAISVLMETPGTFTTGWTEKMGENADYDSYFTAWDDGYTVQPDGSGELQLVEKPAHVCQWSYSIKADQTDIIVATCNGEGECTSTANKELAIIEPLHIEVNDGKNAAATLSATSIGGITELPDIVYYKYSQYPNIDESSATTTPFENVGGTYKAQITVGGVTAYTNYTVKRLDRDNIKSFTISDVTVNSFVITLDEADRSKTDFVCEFGSDKIEFTPDTNGRATITVPDVYAGSNNLWVYVYQKQTDIYKKSNTKDTTVSLKNPEYTVIFNANGGSGTMANQTITLGEATALSENIFTKTGYTFEGWATTAAGTKVYNDKQSVSDLTNAGESITLFAVWNKIPAYAPTIISQPQGFEDANALTYANIGTDKKLSVETDADENEYIVTYQWYKNTTNSKDGAVAIGTEKDLAIENGLSAGDYYYYCKITVTRKDNGESTSVDTDLVKVTVKVAANAIKGLAIEDWTYGESPKTPSASATFGTPAFTYVGTGKTNYAENATPPANAGTYKVIAKVADTANYTGASDEKEFAIAKAKPTYTAPVNLKATYGDT
ncbi:MAG: InlB B-repeat-containing protein, partial [Clostridia bacterium]|nr:InlB B-repeat-containing protein [Clostridia bacterium]